ncbi:MAG: HAMP domain-containing histidine kinase [Agathobacter sp.]|nr:HAMP domain-containing histidine kinase [Agathobacter sp.]
MIALFVILMIGWMALLFLFCLQRLEIRSIEKQLEAILTQDTNELVHAENGSLSKLIGRINELLKETRQSRTNYRSKSRRLEQMMTNISHDLRTPMTSAMGYLNLVLHSDLSEADKEKGIRIVEQRLIRLEELIDSFFEFSKMISGDRRPKTEPVNLTEVLQESMANYFDDFCGQEREVIFRCDWPKLMIESNRNMLMRVFDNLVGNAYKHGTGNLVVTVTQAEGICLTFENELHVQELDTDAIFDEFYTTDMSRTKGNTGLGLAIAKQFTQLLGGTISAEYDGNIFCVKMEFQRYGSMPQ